MSDSLWPHGLLHTRLPCPSPSPRACSNSCPLTQWLHLNISSSVVPFLIHLQSFSASGSFLMSWLFASGRQRIVVSASRSVLPMDTQDWSPLGWTGWISLHSKGLSRIFSIITVRKHWLSFLHSPTFTSIHDHWKSHSFDNMDLCWQSNVSTFNMLSIYKNTFSSNYMIEFNMHVNLAKDTIIFFSKHIILKL